MWYKSYLIRVYELLKLDQISSFKHPGSVSLFYHNFLGKQSQPRSEFNYLFEYFSKRGNVHALMSKQTDDVKLFVIGLFVNPRKYLVCNISRYGIRKKSLLKLILISRFPNPSLVTVYLYCMLSCINLYLREGI